MIYGSTLVFSGEMSAQTLLAFMLYQGQLQERQFLHAPLNALPMPFPTIG